MRQILEVNFNLFEDILWNERAKRSTFDKKIKIIVKNKIFSYFGSARFFKIEPRAYSSLEKISKSRA